MDNPKPLEHKEIDALRTYSLKFDTRRQLDHDDLRTPCFYRQKKFLRPIDDRLMKAVEFMGIPRPPGTTLSIHHTGANTRYIPIHGGK